MTLSCSKQEWQERDMLQCWKALSLPQLPGCFWLSIFCINNLIHQFWNQEPIPFDASQATELHLMYIRILNSFYFLKYSMS